MATCPAQEKSLADFLSKCQGLGVEKYIQPLNARQVSEIIGSKVFGNGIFFPEAGNVHPGKMVLALKRSAIQAGVKIFENTQVERIDEAEGGRQRIKVQDGVLISPQVVLATNVGLSQLPGLGKKLSIFSSFATMSNPCEDALEQLKWHQPVGVNDARMFLHCFRKTADNRVLMGSGSGPIGFTQDASNDRLRTDMNSLLRAQSGMARLLPGASKAGFAKTWGWPIDVSADRVPFFGTLRPGVHYGGGFSGHGVQATWIAGQCLSSLVTGVKDEWSQSIFCQRAVPNLPRNQLNTWGRTPFVGVY
ncbi:NAD(P)/FAD-dependent oxidoreductase [Pseudomonas asiatica]|uniref:NAD(P)/FAD-dependent oxidoreductase n=1 Tax=Pseudomonas asiatica TaxID=2219225 RepID=UPI003D9A0BCA